MIWYDADLGGAGVKQLEQLFGESPYSTNGDQACIKVSGENVAIFGYDPTRIVIFHGPIGDLSPRFREDIGNKLAEVEAIKSEGIIDSYRTRHLD